MVDKKLEELETIVRERLEDSAHNLDHVMRVYKLCLQIAEGQSEINLNVLKAAALLHDIARVEEDSDNTGATDHAILGARESGEILLRLGFAPPFIEAVKECVATHRYKSGSCPQSPEAKILFDADKLDVLGAIGIARCYAIAGRYGMHLYREVNLEHYEQENLVEGSRRIKNLSQHAPNIEFESKLKKIPARLFNPKARAMAEERLGFMKNFFKRLELEIEGAR